MVMWQITWLIAIAMASSIALVILVFLLALFSGDYYALHGYMKFKEQEMRISRMYILKALAIVYRACL